MRTSRLMLARLALFLALVLLLTPLAQAAQPLLALSSARDRYRPQDALGSTQMVTDSSGEVIAEYDYGDFGETTTVSGENVYCPYRYTGQQFDPEAADGGLYYLRARNYSPKIGRFLSRDPIGYAGGSNLYAYCGNDPLNFVDPSGLQERPDSYYERQAKYWVQHPDEAESTLITAGWLLLIGYDAAVALAPAGAYYMIQSGNAWGPGGPRSAPVSPTVGQGMNNPAVARATNMGNRVHYDALNGGQGRACPTELQEMYPETQFAFARRGAAGADVKHIGGPHPSTYPGSKWPADAKYADFKPNTRSGAATFRRDIRVGKLPVGTYMIPYDPKTGGIVW